MHAHENNARALAQTLSKHSLIKKVYYPGLEDHPSYGIAKKQQLGFGGILSFEINNGLQQVEKFFKNLENFSLAESLGGVESLICHPYTMTHAAMSDEQKENAGISQSLIRISAGIEEKDDLTESVLRALE